MHEERKNKVDKKKKIVHRKNKIPLMVIQYILTITRTEIITKLKLYLLFNNI